MGEFARRMLAWFLFAGLMLAAAYSHAQVATLYGPVSDQSAAQVIGQIQQANRVEGDSRPIVLFIDSGGGSLSAGWKIIDAITASRRPVWTVDVGTAASMAAIIFTYGAKRAMFPHAMLMFHHENGQAGGSSEQILAEVGMVRRQVIEIEEHIAKVAQMPVRDFREKESATWWLLADEAVKAHLADQIIVMEQYPIPLAQSEGAEAKK